MRTMWKGIISKIKGLVDKAVEEKLKELNNKKIDC